MSYRLEVDEDVHLGIARCALEQLERAIEELNAGIPEDPVEAVHSARKAVKKERSLLRLAAGALPARRPAHASHRGAARCR